MLLHCTDADAQFLSHLGLPPPFEIAFIEYAARLRREYVDEVVNLYKLPSQRARNSNYEQVLRILNDCFQGSAQSIGFLFGGTPEFLMDQRKGLYSYEALHSRLAENTFAQIANVVDYNSPILILQNLSPEEIYVLLCNIRNVFANGKKENYILPDEALTAFLEHCSKNIGDAYFRTPRNTIKAFVDLLSILEQNPDLNWKTLIGQASGESYSFEWYGNQRVTVVIQPTERRGGIRVAVD